MVFSSTVFLFVFLPITLGVYYIIQPQLRNFWLLVVSLIFYSWGEPKYLILMLVSILINYIFGILIEYCCLNQMIYKSRMLLCFTVIFNMGLLLYFKYYDFFVENINYIFSMTFSLKNIALPVGISFYTFQIMSYVIDVYRRNVKAQYNIFNLWLYISFLPQLIAGPIVRYIDIEKQINTRVLNLEQVHEGVVLFMVGFAKKILIADQLAPLVDVAFASNGTSALLAWTGAIAYALQIYFDFSGYSDMAIGLGKFFGFEFVKNFNYPYISKSIKEFWRRWHISLSTWFKDYVYIPLGGSRCKLMRSYFNLIVVFFLTGFWHGASWNFIIWGLYYVIFLVVEGMGLGKSLEKLPGLFQHMYAMIIILFGWIVFRAENLENALMYIQNMFILNESSWNVFVLNINRQYLFCIFCGIIFSMPLERRLRKNINQYLGEGIYNIFVMLMFLIAIAYMLGSGFSPFLYFRF